MRRDGERSHELIESLMDPVGAVLCDVFAGDCFGDVGSRGDSFAVVRAGPFVAIYYVLIGSGNCIEVVGQRLSGPSFGNLVGVVPAYFGESSSWGTLISYELELFVLLTPDCAGFERCLGEGSFGVE